jgi:hypothetical protein
MSYGKSPIDDFFFSLYGFYPTKPGQAYELLTNAALKLIAEEKKVSYDQYVKGKYSKQVYQIDGIIEERSIEAKDHTIKNEKVTRPEVQHQEGGLIDLPFKEGVFASATGYTRNAKKYAIGTDTNPIAKRIELYNIRPSTTSDEEGRVKTCILEFTIKGLNFKKALITPIFTKNGYYTMGQMFPKGKIPIKIDAIYNTDGSIFISMEDWTYSLNFEYNLEEERTEITGKANFDDKYIKVNSQLIGIQGINYKVPIQRAIEKFVIQQDGKACLYIKNEDGTVDTLLTDIQMKSVKFDEGKKEILMNTRS